MQSNKFKGRNIYKQPFQVMTLQNKIMMKLASQNEAEKAERYTRANVLFNKFEEDTAKHSPRMQDRLNQSLMIGTQPIKKVKAESVHDVSTVASKGERKGLKEPPSAFVGGFERHSIFDESGIGSKWSAEAHPKKFAATPRTHSDNQTPRGVPD